MRKIFTFDGISSEDFGAYISGWKTGDKPVRDREVLTVPGKNGDVIMDNGRYANVNVSYMTYFPSRFHYYYEAFVQFLASRTGYCRLEDDYSPDIYRMGYLSEAFEPSMSQHMKAGNVNIVFSCKPQKWLKDGESLREIPTSVLNRTQFASKPLIRTYGTGTLNINGKGITVTTADGYTDIDCELMEAFKGPVNCNKNIVLSTGDFPELVPGVNQISQSGFDSVLYAPRWWTL